MECCFYVSELPDAWLPYFVLAKQVAGEHGGHPGRLCWVACSVLPMGWLSAVGICQHLHKRMLQLPLKAQGAALPKDKEVRKDRPLPLDPDGRLRRFYQVHIDNFDCGEAVLLPGSAADRRWLKEAHLFQQLLEEAVRADTQYC